MDGFTLFGACGNLLEGLRLKINQSNIPKHKKSE